MYLYGASGHGKVIKEIVESQGEAIEGFVDDNRNINELGGFPVKHSMEGIGEVIVSIGLNRIRKMIVEKLNCKFANAAIHAKAVISRTAKIEEGSVVMAGAIINAEAKIGKHCIINTGSCIDHECKIGDYVHISPHTTLCGNVVVGEGTWIGAGSVVIPGIKIGRWSQIGAGSIVTKDIPDGWLAYGNPCIIVRQLNENV